jgi:hypothetical protein
VDPSDSYNQNVTDVGIPPTAVGGSFILHLNQSLSKHGESHRRQVQKSWDEFKCWYLPRFLSMSRLDFGLCGRNSGGHSDERQPLLTRALNFSCAS